jgi:hypothetical protein
MSIRRFLILLVCLSFIIAGCDVLSWKPAPTFIPEEHIPTLIEMTAQALVDQGLVTPPTPDPVVITPSLTITDIPTITPTPGDTATPTLDVIMGTPEPLTLPDPLPQAEIQIINPGRLSRVISPFKLHVYLALPKSEQEENSSLMISLYGDNGRILEREVIPSEDDESGNSHLVTDFSFDVPGEAETARLEVSAVDPYNRISSLDSTDVILLSDGTQEIKSILDLYASLIIQQPIPSTLIQGDVLIVQGMTRFAPNDELLVELINRDGNQVGSALVPVADDDLGNGFRPFSGEIPYQVGSSSWIRVQVIARDGKFSGIQHLISVEVLVSP